MYILNLLADSASSSSAAKPGLPSWIIWVVLLLLVAVMIVPSYLRSKKDKKAYEEKMSKMTLGSKVKTIGLIMGEIVSMTDDTVTIKTGDEENFSFITVERRAIYEVIPSETKTTDDVYATETQNTDASDEKKESVETSKTETSETKEDSDAKKDE